MMLNSNSIGNKIADARKKKNFSQAELAQQISISAQAVGKWERGESLPDISTLNRLALLLGVDLNYFSDNFNASSSQIIFNEPISASKGSQNVIKQQFNLDTKWNMSNENWVDADFSGLKNIHEKFNATNMKNCKFVGAELSGLILKANNIENCDFSNSDLRNSKIQSSALNNNIFFDSLLIDTVYSQSDIRNSSFNNANLSGAEFLNSNFQKNTIENTVWKHTSFKNTGICEVVFEGNLDDCSFESCSFKSVTFKNATLINTYFKHNRKLNKVQFINCKVDNLTYAFLKNGKADLTDITLI
jgi:uncharacterized protein YjbI with pentapeptide repeats